MRRNTVASIVCALLAVPAMAIAQPAAPRTSWSVAAGYEALAFRDIARTGIPMDGSPVTLGGNGPAVVVTHERTTRSRTHRFASLVTRASGFAYTTPLSKISLGSDAGTSIDGHYEYVRYPFTNVGTDGFDIGVGMRAVAARRSLSRTLSSGLEFDQRHTETGGALSAVGRLTRTRFEIEGAWSAGIVIARSRQSHGANAGVMNSYWGGGWLSEIAARAALRMTDRTALTGAYVFTQDWRMSNHRAFTTQKNRFTLGVTYAR